jgi:hypothetical protein
MQRIRQQNSAVIAIRLRLTRETEVQLLWRGVLAQHDVRFTGSRQIGGEVYDGV